MKTAAEYLAGLSRKAIQRGHTDTLEAVGVAAGLVNPKKQLSIAQMQAIARALDALELEDNDDCTELGVALAEIIRRV